jgi:hypothetical protein
MAKIFLKFRWLAAFTVAYGLFPCAVTAEPSDKQFNRNVKLIINHCKDRVKKYSAQSECSLLSIPRNYCDSEEARRPFKTTDNSDTFIQFVSQFYCVITTENKVKYAERIRFPLQYLGYGGAIGFGSISSVYQKPRFYGEMIIPRGGDDLMFAYAADKRDGFLSLKVKNKNMEDIIWLWRFMLVDDKWTLIIVESEVY